MSITRRIINMKITSKKKVKIITMQSQIILNNLKCSNLIARLISPKKKFNNKRKRMKKNKEKSYKENNLLLPTKIMPNNSNK